MTAAAKSPKAPPATPDTVPPQIAAGSEALAKLMPGGPPAPAAVAEKEIPPPAQADLRMIVIEKISTGSNVRRHVNPTDQTDLIASIQRNGVLQPILVRPLAKGGFALVAGARRLSAAKKAGLTLIPANVREMNEDQALELQLIENVQRANLHPLEEAEGYHALMKHGYDAAKIAGKIGRSVAYVYDRLKLMNLGTRAKDLFLEEILTPGHAILLARLSEKDQKRALESSQVMFEEHLLLDEIGEAQKRGRTRPCSVRELQAWIDRHVRFDARAVDPMLFPETALDIGKAVDAKQKVVAITFENYVPPEARDGKTYGPKSWKRADGDEKSKECEYSKLGYVAAGRRRGESFEVCVAKERCEVHWGAEVRARKKRAAGKLQGNNAAVAEGPAKEEPWAKRNERRAKAQLAYKAIQKPLLDAVAEKVRTVSAGGKGPLAALIMRAIRVYGGAVSDTIPNGASAEQLVRHLAWQVLGQKATGYNSETEFPRAAAELGVDVAKIRKEHAPKPEKPKGKKPAKKKGAK